MKPLAERQAEREKRRAEERAETDPKSIGPGSFDADDAADAGKKRRKGVTTTADLPGDPTANSGGDPSAGNGGGASWGKSPA